MLKGSVTHQTDASFTVEAAFVIPICFFALMSFCCLFQVLRRQNEIQIGLLRMVESYGNQGKMLASVDVLSQNHVLPQWRETDGEAVCYVYDKTDIPFLGSRLFFLRRYQQMVANNYQGVSMIPEEGGGEKVYVAENATVFHRNRECTYLRTRKRAVTVHELSNLRNQSGGKYYPCESCCHSMDQEENATVYITSYGDRYHIYGGCSRIKRNVRKIFRSEAGDLSPCSKCGGERD